MKADWVNRWAGRTVVCAASGPSLTAEDCEMVRAACLPTIVTNTTFRLCPWAEVLFGFDDAWWRAYHDEVDAVFKGAKLCTAHQAVKYGAASTYQQLWFRGFGNSGACAISLAAVGGASKVILIGYDAQKTGGKAHFFGDHPGTMSNCRSMKMWPGKFAQVAAYAKRMNCKVVNASRVSALSCFDRVTLEDALGLKQAIAA